MNIRRKDGFYHTCTCDLYSWSRLLLFLFFCLPFSIDPKKLSVTRKAQEVCLHMYLLWIFFFFLIRMFLLGEFEWALIVMHPILRVPHNPDIHMICSLIVYIYAKLHSFCLQKWILQNSFQTIYPWVLNVMVNWKGGTFYISHFMWARILLMCNITVLSYAYQCHRERIRDFVI